MKTRAQQWSQSAYKQVNRGFSTPDTSEKYNTACNKMPALIHQAGLLQALVFMCARDQPGREYVKDLAIAYHNHSASTAEALIGRAQEAGLAEYLAMTRDLATIAHWFRRFAQVQGGKSQ